MPVHPRTGGEHRSSEPRSLSRSLPDARISPRKPLPSAVRTTPNLKTRGMTFSGGARYSAPVNGKNEIWKGGAPAAYVDALLWVLLAAVALLAVTGAGLALWRVTAWLFETGLFLVIIALAGLFGFWWCTIGLALWLLSCLCRS